MTGYPELATGDSCWHNQLPGISPLGLLFTGVEASGTLSRDVEITRHGDIVNEREKRKQKAE